MQPNRRHSSGGGHSSGYEGVQRRKNQVHHQPDYSKKNNLILLEKLFESPRDILLNKGNGSTHSISIENCASDIKEYKRKNLN